MRVISVTVIDAYTPCKIDQRINASFATRFPPGCIISLRTDQLIEVTVSRATRQNE